MYLTNDAEKIEPNAFILTQSIKNNLSKMVKK